MHRIILDEPVKLKGTGIELEAKLTYLIDSVMLSEVAYACDGKILRATSAKFDPLNNSSPFGDIYLIRSGGAGDLLFLTPTIRSLKKMWPKRKINVVCLSRYAWVFQKNPDVANVLPFPCLADFLEDQHVIALESAVETQWDKHVVDIFAERAGVIVDDKKTLYIPDHTAEDYRAQFPRRRKRVAVQWAASSPVRTYPHTGALLKLLVTRGYEVVIYSDPGRFRVPPEALPQTINLPELGWSWPKNIDFLQTCDAAIGPDSSMVHFAGAMGIPTVALYGSFDWRKRTLYQPSIRPMEATGICAPCYYHAERGAAFPEYCPSQNLNRCDVLGTLTPEMIVEVLEEIIP